MLDTIARHAATDKSIVYATEPHTFVSTALPAKGKVKVQLDRVWSG